MRQDYKALIGILLMMLVSALMAVDSVMVRYLSPTVHPFMMAFTRATFGLIVFLPWIFARKGILKTEFGSEHVVRAALKLAALICFFFAFATASLADVTAIAFTSPLFVTVGAWLFLSEAKNPARIVGLVAGFVGVLIILRPGQQHGVPVGLIFALAGAFLVAVIQLLLKQMSQRDTPETLVAWNLIVSAPLALLPALFFWKMPNGQELMLLAVQGALGAFSMFCATKAFSLAEASLIAPFDFLRLPFVAALGYFMFAQPVPVATWIGGTIIFGASLLMARSARRSAISRT